MSQEYYQPITLKQVVQYSDYVLVVVKEEPFCTDELIPIAPSGHEKETDKYPPFNKRTYHFRVKEILFAHDRMEKGARIEVSPARQEEKFWEHKKYYLEDYSESPIIKTYKPGVKLEETADLIVYLENEEGRRLKFTVPDSYESLSKRKETSALIKKRE